MNEREVEQLLNALCKENCVPMPAYFFIDGKTKEEKIVMESGNIWTKRTLGADYFCTFDKFEEGDLGIIFLSRTKRGVRRSSVIHEFLHYLDHLMGLEVNEKSVRSRERSILKGQRKFRKNLSSL